MTTFLPRHAAIDLTSRGCRPGRQSTERTFPHRRASQQPFAAWKQMGSPQIPVAANINSWKTQDNCNC